MAGTHGSGATPDPLDLLAIDGQLSGEERLIRDTVRRFAQERVRPHLAEWFEQGTFPRHLIPEFGALGLLGMHLTGYGCAGASAVAYGLACMEMEAADSGLRSFMSVQGSLAMRAIHAYGSDEQKDSWLPRMATGEAIGCFGLTEPDAGSNPAGMRTVAKRTADGWVLDGSKMWITNGTVADVAVVWARTDEGFRGFLVPAGTPGFTANPIGRKLSLRVSLTAELVLDGCELPEEAALPGATSLGAPLACLNEARYGIIWGAAGAARDCYETARTYAMTRVQFDRPIAAFQLTQAKLTEMAIAAQRAYLLALHLGRLKDQGTLQPAQVSFGKLDNVRAALEVARTARTVLGASGVTTEYSPLRHANNLESVVTYEGTGEMHTLILGQTITGVPAFR